MEDVQSPSYEDIKTAADIVLSKIPKKPLIGIICGSGLGDLYQILKDKIDIPYDDIPGLPKCSVHGHQSTLTYGTYSDVPIVCFRGRFHLYEGHSVDMVVFPIRLLKLLGGEMIILTNAAGGINSEYAKGDVMLFKDHLNIVGLSGSGSIRTSDERWGPKFFSISYNKKLISKAKEMFAKCGHTGKIHEGVYACVAGPHYETIAEVKFLRLCGADAVGMSTAHEVIAAMHCGLQVLAFSLITDTCVDNYDTEEVITHEEVLQTSGQFGMLLLPFFEELIPNIAEELKPTVDVKAEQEDGQPKKKSCECKANPARKKEL